LWISLAAGVSAAATAAGLALRLDLAVAVGQAFHAALFAHVLRVHDGRHRLRGELVPVANYVALAAVRVVRPQIAVDSAAAARLLVLLRAEVAHPPRVIARAAVLLAIVALDPLRVAQLEVVVAVAPLAVALGLIEHLLARAADRQCIERLGYEAVATLEAGGFPALGAERIVVAVAREVSVRRHGSAICAWELGDPDRCQSLGLPNAAPPRLHDVSRFEVALSADRFVCTRHLGHPERLVATAADVTEGILVPVCTVVAVLAAVTRIGIVATHADWLVPAHRLLVHAEALLPAVVAVAVGSDVAAARALGNCGCLALALEAHVVVGADLV